MGGGCLLVAYKLSKLVFYGITHSNSCAGPPLRGSSPSDMSNSYGLLVLLLHGAQLWQLSKSYLQLGSARFVLLMAACNIPCRKLVAKYISFCSTFYL